MNSTRGLSFFIGKRVLILTVSLRFCWPFPSLSSPFALSELHARQLSKGNKSSSIKTRLLLHFLTSPHRMKIFMQAFLAVKASRDVILGCEALGTDVCSVSAGAWSHSRSAAWEPGDREGHLFSMGLFREITKPGRQLRGLPGKYHFSVDAVCCCWLFSRIQHLGNTQNLFYYFLILPLHRRFWGPFSLLL